jgi:peptidoglycan-N-acetylglucosamine deacetylase
MNHPNTSLGVLAGCRPYADDISGRRSCRVSSLSCRGGVTFHHQGAVTVDDLPEHGDDIPGVSRARIADDVMQALQRNGAATVYGFANGAFLTDSPGEIKILKRWLANGNLLGNHTYDHLDLDKVAVADYVANIEKEDALLKTLTPSTQSRRVFRFPFLAEGNTQQKRNAIREYLAKNGYRVAEVTVDYDDWAWTDAYARCLQHHDTAKIAWLKQHVLDSAQRHLVGSDQLAKRLFGRGIDQILLVHVGEFDAITLDLILNNWRQQGVQFIALDKALSDPVYQIDPNLVSEGGRTFLEQIAESRKIDIDPLVVDTYSVAKLNALCQKGPERAGLTPGAQ